MTITLGNLYADRLFSSNDIFICKDRGTLDSFHSSIVGILIYTLI